MAASLACQCAGGSFACLEEAESSAFPFEARFVAFRKMLAAWPVGQHEAEFEASQAFQDRE